MSVLTQEQRAKVRFFLGYPNLEVRYLIQAGIPRANFTALALEDNMRSILDSYSLTIIADVIDQIDCSRNVINSARSRLKLSRIVGSIELNNSEIEQLWLEDYRLCDQLSTLLSIPIYRHPAIKTKSIQIIGD